MRTLHYAGHSAIVCLLLISGCESGFPIGPAGSTFDSATLITLDDSSDPPTPPANNPLTSLRKKQFTGTISSNAANVYRLGPLEPGDRIIVSVKPASGSQLDPVIAIFDANQELFALNDDVDLTGGRIDSALDEIITTASDPYYLGISRFAFGSSSGEYLCDIEIQRPVAVPVPPVQRLVLDFDGGSIQIPGDQTYIFGAFNADDLRKDSTTDDYQGKTNQIKSIITQTVKSNFAGTGLVITTTDEPLPPAGTYSTIFFGAFSATKFGVAQNVDQSNKNCCDDGIVFIEDFVVPFSPSPSFTGLAIAIGNVAAHEAGHLLGLNHVSDVTALMDTTGTASTLLADQNFKTAPLHESIFPIGFQNDVAILQRLIPAP